MKKKISILACALILVVVFCSLIACVPEEDATYNVSINATTNGKVTASATTAKAETEITLTVTPDNGYKVSEVKMNGTTLTVTNGKATFKMPAADAVITATFIEEEKPTPDEHTITVSDAKGGTVQADKTLAKQGDVVTLTVSANYGYTVSEVKAGSETVAAKDGVYSFVMPNEDVTVTATFALASNVVTSAPQSVTASLSARAPAGEVATADVVIVATSEGIAITAYVTDAVVTEKDGIEVYFGTPAFADGALSQANCGVKVTANGTEVLKVANGVYATDEATTLAGTISPWAQNSEIVGYVAEIVVPYALVSLTEENVNGNVTVLPALANNDRSIAAVSAFGNGEIENPDTYYVFADGKLSTNYYRYGKGTLGQGDTAIATGEYWDLSQDYDVSDERYAERKAILAGHDNADNNIVMYRTKGSELYGKATFTLTGMGSPTESWGKFGLMLFDGATQNGVFFFVDAYIGGSGEHTVDDIVGTGLGYNVAHNGWGSWSGISQTENAYNKTTKTVTLGIAAHDGMVFFWLGEKLVGKTAFEASENTVIGFKSFGYNMEVTNYSVTNDTESEEFTSHVQDVVRQDLDVLFLGDSYMDFWKNLFNDVYNAQTEVIGSRENIGIGGTKIPYWTDNCDFVSKMYNPSKLVFHIGVNDIDDGNTTAEDTFERFKTMLDAYHAKFPQAEIYWVSLVHNTMFAHKCGEYDKMNGYVSAYAETLDYLVYVDVTDVGMDENGNTRVNLFYDGLHFNCEYGYPLWGNKILAALGYADHAEGSTFGDSARNDYSTGWTFSQDGEVAINEVGGEQVLYFKNMDYTTNFYVTAQLYSPDRIGLDAWSKVGLFARNDTMTILGYIDTAYIYAGDSQPIPSKRVYSQVVYRPISSPNGFAIAGDWLWGAQGNGGIASKLVESDFVDVGLAKVGNRIYFTVDNKIVATHVIDGIEDQQFVAGVMGFNRIMQAKNGVVLTGSAEDIERALGLRASDATLDGIADDAIWTEEVLANTHDFGGRADGGHFTLAAVKGSDGVYFLANVWHTTALGTPVQLDGTQWWHYLNLEFRLGNDNDTQRVLWFNNQANGFGGVVTGGLVTVADGELNKTTVEFFVPFGYFNGYDKNSEELRVWVLGWVSDGGWQDVRQDLDVSVHGLRYEHSVSCAEVTGITLVADKTIAYKGDVVTITVNVQEGYNLNKVLVNGEEIVAVDGVYSFVMKDENATITATLKGRHSVDMTAVEGKLTVDNSSPLEGEVITFSSVAPFVATKVYANGVEIVAVDGVFSTTVGTEDLIITAEFDYVVDGYKIDGVLEEDYGEMQHFYVEGNRDVTIYARKTASGVVLYAIAHTDANVTDAAEWYLNHNVEFYFNGFGAQRYVNNKNEAGGVTYFCRTSQLLDSGEYNGKYEHRYEIYVEGSTIETFDSDNIQFNYAYKAPTESARWEGMSNDTWGRGDWWNNVVGGVDTNMVTSYGHYAARPANLYVTADGLVSTQPKATHATIDANFQEYSEKTVATRGNVNAKFDITGFVADDGYYLAISAYQKITAEPTAEWWLNDNLEIQLFGQNVGFSIFDKFICAHGAVSQYAMNRSSIDQDGYTVRTDIELFIAQSNAKTGYFKFLCNGNGFQGLQFLAWDGADRIKLNANGAEFVVENYVQHAANADNVALDGNLDEEFWNGVTLWNNANCPSFSDNGVYATIQAKKGNAGVYLAVTLYHNTGYDQKIQGDGTQWWNYLNLEFRFVVNSDWNGALQRAVCPWNNGKLNCEAGWTSVENTQEIAGRSFAYKTVFEVLTPYEWDMGAFPVHEDMPLWIGCVAEKGFYWVLDFGVDQTAPTVVTDEGFIRK